MKTIKYNPCNVLFVSMFLLQSADAHASDPLSTGSGTIAWVLIIAGISLLPFLLMMITSFTKIIIVFSILRSAIGTQQVPPNQVILSLALLLSIFIMMPVGQQISQSLGTEDFSQTIKGSTADLKSLIGAVDRCKEPVRQFLVKHVHEKERVLFAQLYKKGSNQTASEKDLKDHFLILIPSFMISEIKEAFQIGFLLFLPFIVIDMVVSNILQAMGMVMLSPTTISLPFKLLLFVLADGWSAICSGLINGYMR